MCIFLKFYKYAASALKDEADALAAKYPVEPVLLDVTGRTDLLADHIRKADIVISLLPYGLHAQVKKYIISISYHVIL